MALPLPGGPDDDPDRQQKFDDLARAMPGFGGKSVEIRHGSGSVTFTASTVSATTTIPHGLGRTPSNVQLTTASALGFGVTHSAKGATTFAVQGWTTSAATTTVFFDWTATG